MKLVLRGVRLDKKHQKGFLNHLRAIEWLTAQEYYVFDNISGLGPCDLVALGEDGEVITSKIDGKYKTLVKDIYENSNIQLIVKNKSNEYIMNLIDDLLKDHKEQSNLKKIESLEQELINNLDENSYTELIKLKSQLNRD